MLSIYVESEKYGIGLVKLLLHEDTRVDAIAIAPEIVDFLTEKEWWDHLNDPEVFVRGYLSREEIAPWATLKDLGLEGMHCNPSRLRLTYKSIQTDDHIQSNE